MVMPYGYIYMEGRTSQLILCLHWKSGKLYVIVPYVITMYFIMTLQIAAKPSMRNGIYLKGAVVTPLILRAIQFLLRNRFGNPDGGILITNIKRYNL